MSQVEALKALSEVPEEELREGLGEMVHSLKAREATNINNGGIDAQLIFLMGNGISIVEIQQGLSS